MLLILAFYFSNYCINFTLEERKASNIIRDIGMVTDSIYDFAYCLACIQWCLASLIGY